MTPMGVCGIPAGKSRLSRLMSVPLMGLFFSLTGGDEVERQCEWGRKRVGLKLVRLDGGKGPNSDARL